MADSFKPGDKVRHKSGGPVMILERTGKKSYTEEEAVWCEWMDARGHVQHATFVPDVLESVTEEPVGVPQVINPRGPSLS